MEFYFNEKRKEITKVLSDAINNGITKNLFRGSSSAYVFINPIKTYIKDLNNGLFEKLDKSTNRCVFKLNDKLYVKKIKEIKYEIENQLNKTLPNLIRSSEMKALIYDNLENEINTAIEEWNNICKHRQEPLIDKFKNTGIIIGLLGGVPFIFEKIIIPMCVLIKNLLHLN